MASFPSIIGQCGAVRDSRRGIGRATMTFTGDYSVTYAGPEPGTVTMSASATLTWIRLPFPSGVAHLRDVPGVGNFFVAQAGCCCACRAIYAFDEVPLEFTIAGDGTVIPGTAGAIGMDVSVAKNDRGDIHSLARVVTLQLWDANAPPCRKADGPPGGSPSARLGVPVEYFQRLLDPDPLITDPVSPALVVSGTCFPVDDGQGEADADLYYFDFSKPAPCADTQNYTVTVDAAWHGSQVSGTASMTFTFVVGP